MELSGNHNFVDMSITLYIRLSLFYTGFYRAIRTQGT